MAAPQDDTPDQLAGPGETQAPTTDEAEAAPARDAATEAAARAAAL
ncbi:mannose-binding protein, partial [Pseudoroseomonas wenyumeiae]